MIGVIADDLTGAAELGGIGFRYGLSAKVVLEADRGGETELLCSDTDSRSAPLEAAGRLAATAARALTAAGANWVYQKVDSVLRGHVAVELEAVINQLGLRRVLLVPANPGLGRVIRNGCYFIGGKPIHETDFRLDPEYPCGTPWVRELLGTAISLPVQVCRLRERLPPNGIVIGECETAADLRQWAGRWDDSTLAAGAAEFFAALLETLGRSPARAFAGPSAASTARPELFVCGSTSESCRAFVTRSRDHGVPVVCLPEETARGVEFAPSECERLAERVKAALQSNPRVILAVGLPPVTDRRVARQLVGHLTGIAAAVMQQSTVGHVYVEGGATATSLTRKMNWKHLSVKCEVAPGVVTLQPAGERSRLLTLKPGSYVWPKGVS